MNFNKVLEIGKKVWFRLRWWWILILVVVLAAGGAAYYYFAPKGSQTTSSSSTNSSIPSYNTTTVTQGNISITAAGSGTLVADPQINLAFSTDGRVGQLNVKVGDQVTKDEVLAKLDNTEKLQANVANDQLAIINDQQALDDLNTNAQVNLATAYQTFAAAQKTYNDSLTAEQRTAYARCSKEKNTQLLDKYETALENLTKLSSTAYGSDPWITAKNDFDTAEANYNYCSSYTQDEVTGAKANTSIAKSKLDQAQIDYDTLNNNKGIDPKKLEADQATLKKDQLQLSQDQSNLAGTTITSPINGTVISIAANQGEVVDTSTYMVVADLNVSKVQVEINETDLNKMAIGNAAQIIFDALPKQTFTGKVVQINPALTSSGSTTIITGLITLDQVPINPANNHLLPLGLNSTVTIINNQANNILIVSSNALRDLGDGTYGVFVVGKDKKLQFKLVQVGLKDSINAEIKSGLSLGDTVSTGSAKAAK